MTRVPGPIPPRGKVNSRSLVLWEPFGCTVTITIRGLDIHSGPETAVRAYGLAHLGYMLQLEGCDPETVLKMLLPLTSAVTGGHTEHDKGPPEGCSDWTLGHEPT